MGVERLARVRHALRLRLRACHPSTTTWNARLVPNRRLSVGGAWHHRHGRRDDWRWLRVDGNRRGGRSRRYKRRSSRAGGGERRRRRGHHRRNGNRSGGGPRALPPASRLDDRKILSPFHLVPRDAKFPRPAAVDWRAKIREGVGIERVRVGSLVTRWARTDQLRVPDRRRAAGRGERRGDSQEQAERWARHRSIQKRERNR
jgi:hypothetical protein